MNAVDKLEAAIEKLETLKLDTTIGPWLFGYGTDGNPFDGPTFTSVYSDVISEHASDVARLDYSEVGAAAADLIVTLHRTIDAQLAILRVALAYEKSMYGTGAAEEFHRKALALAFAILGES